jgi:hypothetical protein
MLGNAEVVHPASEVLQVLASFFEGVCQSENAQKVVGCGSGLSVVCGCESAQKSVGEGSSEGRPLR